MRRINTRIRTGRGYGIALTATLPMGSQTKPLVVLCHGLGIDSQKPLLVSIRMELLNAGYGVVQFDFAGHGKSGGGIQQRLVGTFVRDLDTVVHWLSARGISNQEGVVVVGYSIGALATLLYAGLKQKRLRAIALIGCNARSKEKFRELQARGKLQFERTYCIVGRTKVARSFWSQRNHYEPRSYAGNIRIPALLICGAKDVTNPLHESQLLYRWIKAPKQLAVIPGCDHYFTSIRSQLRTARAIRSWLRRIL